MVNYFLQGFMLGIAYVAPIGMQNIYVINSALRSSRLRAYTVALITVFFDITLAIACFFGMGALMEKSQYIKLGILLFGGLAVVYIGIQLIKSIPSIDKEVDVAKPISQVIMACMLVTWANPQALIDGSLLLGGFKAALSPEASRLFIMGVCSASITWFFSITTLVSIFKNSFNDKVIKTINTLCGAVLIYYGLKLLYTFITAIKA